MSIRNWVYNNQTLQNIVFNNGIGFNLYHLIKPEYDLSLLKANKKFKDIHLGKRCFILGNGPSLKTEDLTPLKDEYTFVVNQFARNKYAPIIKPKYHVWADPSFFEKTNNEDADSEVYKTMLSISEFNPNVETFYSLDFSHFVIEHGLNKKTNGNYFLGRLNFGKFGNKDIDLTRFIPAFGTVVQYAIEIAVYMGFSEIYLLGCDNTGLMVNFKSALKQNDDDDYGYTVTDNEKKRMEYLMQKNGLEGYVRMYLSILVDYRNWKKYCDNRNIKLINCSSTTVIDSIPRMKFCDVMNSK